MLLTWLQQTPGWVLPGASLDLNFAAGTYYPAGVDSLITATRAQTVSSYATTSTGSLTAFAANTPRITDLGLLVEQARTNLMLQSQTLATSPWGESHAGTGTAPTVTNAFGIAPDGTTTACRVQMALNGGTTSSDRVDWAQTVTVANATVYTLSFYVQSNTASTYAMQMGDSTTGTISAISVTPTAARVSMQFTTGSTTATPRLRLRGGQTPTNSDSVDILVWGADLEAGSFATSYIPTTTVAVARAADNIVPAGAAANAFKPATVSIFVQSNNVASFASFPRYIGYSNGHAPLQITNNTKTSTYNGSVELDATLGSGTVTGGTVKTAVGYDGTGRSIVANNGTVATDANVEALGVATVFIGAQSAGGQFLNGYIGRLAVYGRRLSDAQLQALTA